MVALGARSDTEASRACGVSKTTWSNWRTRNSVPYTTCVQLAEERGISLDWLLLGEGEMTKERPKQAGPILDMNRLIQVVEELESALGRHERTLDPARKARAIALMYEFATTAGQEPASVDRLLELIV